MSYARFSSDNFKSDVYAYESDYGFVVHVAAVRVVDEIPAVNWRDPNVDAVIAAHSAQMAALEVARREPIDLPHAGQTFHEADLDSLEARLRQLRELGYHVPEHAFEIIAWEREQGAEDEEDEA